MEEKILQYKIGTDRIKHSECNSKHKSISISQLEEGSLDPGIKDNLVMMKKAI